MTAASPSKPIQAGAPAGAGEINPSYNPAAAGVRRESDADAAQRAQYLFEPSLGFWHGITRDECPYAPDTAEARGWLAKWDLQLLQAYSDFLANRVVIDRGRDLRAAVEAAASTLLQCEKNLKAPGLRSRCRNDRAALFALLPMLKSPDNDEARS